MNKNTYLKRGVIIVLLLCILDYGIFYTRIIPIEGNATVKSVQKSCLYDSMPDINCYVYVDGYVIEITKEDAKSLANSTGQLVEYKGKKRLLQAGIKSVTTKCKGCYIKIAK